MPTTKEKEILDFLSALLALEQLKDILEKVVSDAPHIINCDGCSIYLIPELVKQYQNEVLDRNNNRIDHYAVGDPFIVLAAHSHSKEAFYKIGKHFYCSGEGLTGWVFKFEKPLFLDDLSDPEQIRKNPGLKWENKYGHAGKWYTQKGSTHPKPFIALPLIPGKRCVGVVRFVNTADGKAFSDLAKATVLSFGDLITRRIETELSIQDKQRSIKNLISIGAMSNEPGVFKAIVEESQKTVGASACRLFILDKYGEEVALIEATDSDVHPDLKKTFKRGEGYVGWVFKYGVPLLINKIAPLIRLHCYNIEAHTGMADFFSIFGENEQTIPIAPSADEVGGDDISYSQFLGVPLSKGKARIHGVLVALSRPGRKPFNNEDLYLLRNLGQTVCQLMESLRQQELNDLLIRMGHDYGDALFQYVVERIPSLVVARGCSIFRRSETNSSKSRKDNTFVLKYTSSKWLKDDDGNVLDIAYQPGKGKTGFVAEYGRILVINHYGVGDKDDEKIDLQRLDSDLRNYTHYPHHQELSVVKKITNNRGEAHGLARMIRDKNDPLFTPAEREAFEVFIDGNPYISKEGLECHEQKKLCEEGTDGGFSTSFLGVPFRDRQGNVYGVLRIPKSSPGGNFTDQDIELVVSVSNRLFSYIELEQNLLTLTSINTQINANFGIGDLDGILKDILVAVTDTLGFEFVTIQLVSRDKKTIAYKDGRKHPRIVDAPNPEEWGSKVKYDLDAEQPDIHVWLLREYKKPFVVKGWNQFFSKRIYDEHDHKSLIRAFIPIIIQNTEEIIGTIEAGHHIRRRNFIDREEINMLKALADSAAIAIKNAHLHEELKTKIEQLKRAYKELATVSHDLKTPLTPIKYYLDIVLAGFLGDLTPEQHRATINAMRNLNEETRLINNILDLASIGITRSTSNPRSWICATSLPLSSICLITWLKKKTSRSSMVLTVSPLRQRLTVKESKEC